MITDGTHRAQLVHERADLLSALEEMLEAEATGTQWPGASSAHQADAGQRVLDRCERYGLARLGEQADFAFVSNAGRQFVALGGQVDRDVLGFFAIHIDDLHARAALLRVSRRLIDRFSDAAVDGTLRQHVAERVVPPAWAAVVDDQVAAHFYAAASAMIVRVAVDEVTHCLAENVVLLAFVRAAAAELERDPELNDEDKEWASRALEQAWHPGEGAEDLDALEEDGVVVSASAIRSWFAPVPGAPRAGHVGWSGGH